MDVFGLWVSLHLPVTTQVSATPPWKALLCDVSQGDGDTQPGYFDPRGEFAPFRVGGPQDVAITLDGIQDALKTSTIPVSGDLAAQNIQPVQVALPRAEVLSRQCYLVADPISDGRAIHCDFVRLYAVITQQLAWYVDETLV
jgi:hypothetical protein